MSNESLFQKYRSQGFSDLVGQEVVVHTLQNALRSGNPARAYLFCGPRGTGKTSTARILAKALNCESGPTPEPCCTCRTCQRIAAGSCLDVMEIDAASHTQVDKIREFIVDKVQFAPAEARYKVYIIDEVHKLSTASFNALLKTLEEPPAHVVFILATTHPHELLPTILSRCQRHDFQRLTQLQIAGRIKYVAGREGFTIEDGAAEQLGRAADGSLRDALVGLEQAATYGDGKVTEALVRELLGLAGASAVSDLVRAMESNNVAGALEILNGLVSSGRDLGRLCSELLEYLRLIMLSVVKCGDVATAGLADGVVAEIEAHAAALKLGRLFSWIGALNDLQPKVKNCSQARLLWEMMLIRLASPELDVSLEGLSNRIARLEQVVARLEQGGVGVAPGRVSGASGRVPGATGGSASAGSVRGSDVVIPAGVAAAQQALQQSAASASRYTPVSGGRVAAARGGDGGWGSSSAATSRAATSNVAHSAGPVAAARGGDGGWGSGSAATGRATTSSGAPSAGPATAARGGDGGWGSNNAATSSVATSGATVSGKNETLHQDTAELGWGSEGGKHGNERIYEKKESSVRSYRDPADFWQIFLTEMQTRNVPLAACLKDTTCYKVGEGKLVILVKESRAFSVDVISSHRQEIERGVKDIFGLTVVLRVCVDDSADEDESEAVAHRELVGRVCACFGGKALE